MRIIQDIQNQEYKYPVTRLAQAFAASAGLCLIVSQCSPEAAKPVAVANTEAALTSAQLEPVDPYDKWTACIRHQAAVARMASLSPQKTDQLLGVCVNFVPGHSL